MAIGFVRAKIISRAKGQSAVACAAYRSGEKLEDDRYGKTHDYRRKEKILATGLERPEGAPDWNRQELWNEVEKSEGRKDSQLSKEFILALPHECTKEQNTEIMKAVAKYLTDQGMYVDWAYHDAPKQGDQRNQHGHLMTTMREITPEGFGNKNRDWNKKSWMKDLRKKTIEIINEHLVVKLEYKENREKGLPKSHHLGVAVVNAQRRNGKKSELTAELAEVNKALSELAAEQAPQPKKTVEKKPQGIEEYLTEQAKIAKAHYDAGRIEPAYKVITAAEDAARNMLKPSVEASLKTYLKKYYDTLKDCDQQTKEMAEAIASVQKDYPWRYQRPTENLPDKPPIIKTDKYLRLVQQHKDYETSRELAKQIDSDRRAAQMQIDKHGQQFVNAQISNTLRDIIERLGLRPLIDSIKQAWQYLTHSTTKDRTQGR